MERNFLELSNEEMEQIDGGSFLGTVATVAKVAGTVAGVGLGGLAVGAGAVIGTYYVCKWIFD